MNNGVIRLWASSGWITVDTAFSNHFSVPHFYSPFEGLSLTIFLSGVRIYVKAINEKFVEKLRKGTSITVAGEIGYNEYEDQNGSQQKRMYMDAQPSDVTISGQ